MSTEGMPPTFPGSPPGPPPKSVADPFSAAVLCWCGLVFPSNFEAARCDHASTPYVPGDRMYAARLHAGRTYKGRGYRRRRLLRVALALVVIVLFVACSVGGGLAWGKSHPARQPVVTPTPYGPPPAGWPTVRT